MKLLTSTRAGSRGFTLIELGITIAILALVAMIVVPSVEAAFGVKTREEAAALAGAIRAMYAESALSGRTCRLVFDLENGAYWPECAEGRIAVAGREESIRGARIEDDEEFNGTEEQEAAHREVEAKRAFAAFESGLAPKRQLPESVFLDTVWTQHQSEPYTGGTAYLYFWPNGQTERAYLYVADDEDTFTLIVNPMTGRSRVEPDRIDIPSEAMRR